MQFKQGTSVYTTDDKDVGRVDRVVLNPNTKEVTHIIVRKGFLFTEDKAVPLDVVASATEDRVVLNKDSKSLDALPAFEEVHYVPLDEAETQAADYPVGLADPFYWYQPLTGSMSYPDYAPAYAYQQPYRTETEQNIPENTVALKEGAQVVSADNQNVGSVKRVFTKADSDGATYFLISDGLIFKEQKLIPMGWIRDITENEVRLNVGASILKGLPEFQGSPASA